MTSFLLAVVAVASAAAQTLRADVPMDIASTPLVGDSTIQTHLKLDKGQKDKVLAIFREYGEWVQKQSRPKSEAEAQALQKKARENQLSTGKKVLALLSQTQRTRLRQLGLQLYGPFTFFAPDVKKELKITPDQLKKMQAIQNQFQDSVTALEKKRNAELAKIPKPKDQNDKAAVEAYMKQAQSLVAKFGPQDQKTMAEAKRKAEAALIGVLTAEQKKQWQSMQGAKYNFVNQRRGGKA